MASSRYQPPPKNDFNTISLFICIGMLFISPPIGILLLLFRWFRNKESQQQKNDRDFLNGLKDSPSLNGQTGSTQRPAGNAASPFPHGVNAPPPPSSRRSGRAVAPPPSTKEKRPWILMAILGIACMIFGVSLCMDPLEYLSYGLFDMHDLWQLLQGVVAFACGGGLLWYGSKIQKRFKLSEKLRVLVGNKNYYRLSDFVKKLHCKEKDMLSALQSGIDTGKFGKNAYIDYETGYLVVTAPPPLEEPQPTPKKPKAKKSENQYQDILDQLRSVNEAIPGEAMTAKISRLEDISARIFKLAQENPDKLPQLRKFMSYYLPTSLKLLTAYAQLDAQGIEGENISASKKKIEDTMDTLCDAFAAQLDKLFASDALDISSDIDAMQMMLQQDGLAADELTIDTTGL